MTRWQEKMKKKTLAQCKMIWPRFEEIVLLRQWNVEMHFIFHFVFMWHFSSCFFFLFEILFNIRQMVKNNDSLIRSDFALTSFHLFGAMVKWIAWECATNRQFVQCSSFSIFNKQLAQNWKLLKIFTIDEQICVFGNNAYQPSEKW